MNKLNLLSITKFLSVCFLLLTTYFVNAQLATYPFRSSGITPQPGNGNAFPSSTGLTSANVNTGKITVGNAMASASAGSFNGGGLRIKTNSLTWPSTPTDGFHIDVPLSPKPNYDFTLTGIQFKDSIHENNVDFLAKVAYQTDGTGNWNFIGTSTNINTPNSIINFGTLNQGFYDGHTYTFRIYFYANGNAAAITDKNNAFRINFLVFNGATITPPSINPDVHTTGVSNTGFYSTTATGTYDVGAGFRIVNQAGFLCGTNNTPTFANASPTYVTTLGSPMSAMINGLTPGTSYYVRAFAITQTDTILANIGEIIFVKTIDPQEPLINTLPPYMATVVKATTGGWAIDSAGSAVVEKGILYSTNPVMSYPTTTHTSDGKGNSDFYTKINNLLPNTKYYVMAFARNAFGVGYGNLDSVITGPPAPYISATPENLDFGDLTYNSNPIILSYKLNANYLNPSGGIIALNATNGYTISTTYNGTYNSTLNFAYNAGAVANKIIYVKPKTNSYGYTSGIITHSGGGVVSPNADTVKLIANVIQNADTLSNAGTDFWCGFGYQEKMSQKAGNASEAKLSIYVTTGNQAATVHVDLTSGGYSQTITIPANSYHEFNNFPTGDPANNYNGAGLPDSRLYSTGISNKSIHIYSDNGVPVSAFLHSYTDGNSAAGAMLFPTNTWNSSYTVQAFGGKSNNSNPNSFFFVIANQDSTVVTFKPTQPIIDSASSFSSAQTTSSKTAYATGITHTVTLNKGQVFNAMGGFGSNNDGLDLSGTSVSTTCDKKITVFGGNGRCLVNGIGCSQGTGSDHLIQQMFPSVAWGTKYLTVPTKGEDLNYFRIYVQNPTQFGATKVWVNNPSHSTPLPVASLVNNLYYEYQSNAPSLIESDKPINVTQFILTPKCVNNIIDGGPEMIMLSPIQQSISSATVYSAAGKDGSASQTPSSGASSGNSSSYINVIIPTIDTGNFRLDGSNLVDTGKALSLYANGTKILASNAFKKHPQDSNYCYANFWVTAPALHTLKANKGFNAIAYGLGSGESYGYNAGTTINNLSAVNISVNPAGTDTSSGSIKTVKNNLVYLQIAVPYDSATINSIIWDGQGNTNVNPNTPQNGIINPSTNKPLCLGTIIKDGRTFYVYQSPVQYTFTDDGAYKIKVTLNGTFASDCGGFDVKYINVIVGHDDISFTTNRIPANDCTSKTIELVDNSTGFAGTSISTYIWDYGDASKKDTIKSTQTGFPYPTPNSHTYASNTIYYVKLTTINSVGGVSTDSAKVDLSLLTSPTFSTSSDSICPNNTIVFTTLTSNGGAKWFWDYGDGSAIDSTTTQTPVSHIYTIEGIHYVKHWVKNSAGCPSNIAIDSIVVLHKPVAAFLPPSGVCLPGVTLFINTSDTAAGVNAMPYNYHWDFGVTALTSDTSNKKDGSYQYANPPGPSGYTVKLTAISKYGCVSDTAQQIIKNVYSKPKAFVDVTSDKKVCVGSIANFYDGSSAIGQTITSWYWNFGDGNIASNNPAKNTYITNTTYTVKLVVQTDKGCRSDTASWTVKVNPKPVAASILPSSCITSGPLFFQDNSTVATDDSVQTPYTYTWNFGDGPAIYTTKDSTHTYSSTGTYFITHSITTSNNCSDTRVDTFTISGSKPLPKYDIPNAGQMCNNQTLYLRDSSTISIGTIKKVEIYWDYYNRLGLNIPVVTDNNPQNGVGPVTTKVYSYKYPTSSIGKNGIKVFVFTYNDNNCFSVDSITVNTYGSPKAIFDTIKGICVNGAPKLINLARDSSGKFDNLAVAFKPVYSGNGVYNDSMFNASVAGIGTHLIKVLYETKIPFFNHCIDSAFAPIAVWGLPSVDFDTALIKCEKDAIKFIDKSTAASGSGTISSWLWNFGNPASGINDSSKQQNPSHTYNSFGAYTITLKVTSDSGCSNTISIPKTIVVNPKPIVGFIPPKGACQGSPVTFTDTSKIADGTGALFTHTWTFGDPASGINNTATGKPLPNPQHLYSGGATDSVRLMVTSNNGCVDSAVKLVNSSITFPQITPTYKINGVLRDTNQVVRTCSGNSLHFASGFKANSYTWTFNDTAGITYNVASLNHTYPTAKTYKGSFSMIDSNGCNTKAVPFNVEIWALPIVAFDTPLIKCEKSAVIFNDKSIASVGNITSWFWKFGDPASGAMDSSKTNPSSHIYNTYGSYDVSLKVTTDSGCSATLSPAKKIVINPKPNADFIIQDTTCLPNATTFTSTSTIADGTTPVGYLWNFGDAASGLNNTSILNPASHVYSSINNYNVQLIVASAFGCTDTLQNIILKASSLHNPPVALYTVNTLSHDTPRVCVGTPIIFKDASSNVKTSYWVWGDNGATIELGTLPAPQFSTSPAGIYNGQHYIDDNWGCRSIPTPIVTIIDALPSVERNVVKYFLANTPNMLTPTITNATSFAWTVTYPSGLTNDYLDYNDVSTPICTPLTDVTYLITATNDGGCKDTASYYIKLLKTPQIPTAFSPNGDGINDYWVIDNLKEYAGATVQVFDRYGQVVLNKFGYSTPWNGKMNGNGNDLPIGVYYYIIKPGSGLPVITGYVTILR